MTYLLSDLLGAGLIEKMDGSDERFAKLKKAAAALAEELQSQPYDLMYALLAALDPDIPVADPSILRAEAALKANWETMGGIYTDKPVNLFRSLLLEACNQCAEGKNAVVLWLMAADSLEFCRLGKEENVVRGFLQELGRKAEAVAINYAPNTVKLLGEEAGSDEKFLIECGRVENSDRKNLLMTVAAALGPDYRGSALKDSNPNWQSQGTHYGGGPVQDWNYQCADKLSVLLADEIDNFAEQMQQGQEDFAERMQSFLQTQRQAIQAVITDHERHRHTEQVRLDALWWSEALYSPTLSQSYRELKPEVAALVMAQDLLQVVSMPTPASVSHLLAETVQRLPNAGYEIKKPIREWLEQLRQCNSKPALEFASVPKEGRLSVRDVFAWSVSDQTWDTTHALQRAGIEATHEISLPALARTLFRQEQACRLASAAKDEL